MVQPFYQRDVVVLVLPEKHQTWLMVPNALGRLDPLRDGTTGDIIDFRGGRSGAKRALHVVTRMVKENW